LDVIGRRDDLAGFLVVAAGFAEHVLHDAVEREHGHGQSSTTCTTWTDDSTGPARSSSEASTPSSAMIRRAIAMASMNAASKNRRLLIPSKPTISSISSESSTETFAQTFLIGRAGGSQ